MAGILKEVVMSQCVGEVPHLGVNQEVSGRIAESLKLNRRVVNGDSADFAGISCTSVALRP